jgi:quercetin dioxygenase-like cupin family protein
VQLWELDRLPVAAHHPEVIRSDDDANRVIVLQLPAGESLQEHQVHEHALVFVLDGEARISAGEDRRLVSAPGLVHFKPGERHAVEAVSDTRLVLCLAPWPGVGHPSRPADSPAA